MARRRLLAAILLLLAASQPAASAAPPTYPLDWSLVPDAPAGGAAAAAAAAANLTAGCACALLNATCTPNCCCDPACSDAARAAFRAAGASLPEGGPPDTLAFCTPGERFAQVNLPGGNFFRLHQLAAGTGLLSQLLCVAADHNPRLGDAYPDPPAGDDVATNAQEAACPVPPAPAPAPSAVAGASYAFGQPLLVVAPAAGISSARPLTLPAAALSAECLDVARVGFMQRLPASPNALEAACSLTLSSVPQMVALCGGTAAPLLSPSFYAALSFPATPGASVLVPARVESLARLDAASGELLPLNVSTDLRPPALGAANCSGLVVGGHFLFRVATDPDSGASSITSASLALVVGDAALPAGGAPLVLRTAFSVSWANASTPAGALRPFSGAPGYQAGLPLLAGRAVSARSADGGAKAAVARYTDGLRLPAPGLGGACSASAQDTTGVRFGYNVTSSCDVTLTLPELRALCLSDNATRPLRDVLGGWLDYLAQDQVLLGVWGNSDAAHVRQWVALRAGGGPPGGGLVWDEASATCHNVVSGLRLRLLTGLAAPAAAPQAKLLAASACWSTSSWRFVSGRGGAQAFPLSFAAAFVAKAGQATVAAVRPRPPLFAPLPRDLFYPFSS